MAVNTLNSNLILLIRKLSSCPHQTACPLNSNLILLILGGNRNGGAGAVDFKFQSDSINT